MAFWSDTSIEPKRSFRWILTFSGDADGLSSLRFALHKAKKPKMSQEVKEHWFLNHQFKFPGRIKWADISFEVVNIPQSAGTLDTTQAFMNAMFLAGYQLPTDVIPNGLIKTISKTDMNTQLGNFNIAQIAPDGTEIELWTIQNPIIKSIDFGGDLSWDSEEIQSVVCEVSYDWAVLTTR